MVYILHAVVHAGVVVYDLHAVVHAGGAIGSRVRVDPYVWCCVASSLLHAGAVGVTGGIYVHVKCGVGCWVPGIRPSSGTQPRKAGQLV